MRLASNPAIARRARRPLMIAALALAMGTTLATACTKKEEAPPPRTDAQKRAGDSTLGASRIPGAAGVKNAMVVSDSAARRKAVLDSMASNP